MRRIRRGVNRIRRSLYSRTVAGRLIGRAAISTGLAYKNLRRNGEDIKTGDYMDNDKEGSLGLVLLLIIGCLYRLAGWFGFIRIRLIKLVKNKGAAAPIHCDSVKGSNVIAESGR
jgi:hypothetical protein